MSNPEGINQYTGSGGVPKEHVLAQLTHAAEMAKKDSHEGRDLSTLQRTANMKSYGPSDPAHFMKADAAGELKGIQDSRKYVVEARKAYSEIKNGGDPVKVLEALGKHLPEKQPGRAGTFTNQSHERAVKIAKGEVPVHPKMLEKYQAKLTAKPLQQWADARRRGE
jgi:hypothetical protein